MKEIDKIALIIIENGKILSTKSIGKNKYYIPGDNNEKIFFRADVERSFAFHKTLLCQGFKKE